MRTLEDIDTLCDNQYGLKNTMNIFRNQTNTKFYGALKEWRNIGETCDEIIGRHHRVSPNVLSMDIPEIPFIAGFREAYRDILYDMPDDINECHRSLDDIFTTLQGIKSLHNVTPFAQNGQEVDTIVWHLRAGSIGEKHISDERGLMPQLSAKTTAGWNTHRKRTKPEAREMTPWDTPTFQQTVLGRADITAKRLYPDGIRKVMGYFILRHEEEGDRLALIDWAAEPAPGVSDILATVLVLQLRELNQKRIENLLEQFH